MILLVPLFTIKLYVGFDIINIVNGRKRYQRLKYVMRFINMQKLIKNT